jgi:gas vesicle protein
MKDEELPSEPISEELEHHPSSRGTAGFIAGLLFGAFMGGAFALLFAPEQGKKTRGRFRERMRSLGQDAMEGIDRASARTKKELRRRRRRFQAELERARERAEDARD